MATIALQQEFEETAKIIGHVELPGQKELSKPDTNLDDFLSSQAASPWAHEAVQRDYDRLRAEIAELKIGNRWEDILVLLHPVAEKWPDLCDSGLDSELIRESGFVLCRLGRHDESMAVIKPLTVAEPDNALAWYNLGYAAYDSLYANRRDRSPMPHAKRRDLIKTAHHAFGRCQNLKPDSVAFFYRDAMVYKDFEDKLHQAIPVFERAVANYEKLSQEEKDTRHQQRPKYIRSMYHLASCFLKCGQPASSKILLDKVIVEDQNRNHMSPLFKHYAYAKTLHALGENKKALDHLETAAARASQSDNIDYVFELSGRCALILKQITRAGKYIDHIPEYKRRPYIRWTEADILAARGRYSQAVQVLEKSAERDRRSRHKSLIRAARIYITVAEYEKGLDAAHRADMFCNDTYGNGSREAQFWAAACLYRLERYDEAETIISELIKYSFNYPNLKLLAESIRKRKQIARKPLVKLVK